MYFRQLTPFTGEYVTLNEVKEHCRDDNTMLQTYLDAATEAVIKYTGRHILSAQYEYGVDDPDGDIILPGRPLLKVDEVKLSGAVITNYNVVPDDRAPYIWTEDNWRASGKNALVVKYTLGFENTAMIPASFKEAILLMVEHWNSNRVPVIVGAAANQIPMSAKMLLDLKRGAFA